MQAAVGVDAELRHRDEIGPLQQVGEIFQMAGQPEVVIPDLGDMGRLRALEHGRAMRLAMPLPLGKGKDADPVVTVGKVLRDGGALGPHHQHRPAIDRLDTRDGKAHDRPVAVLQDGRDLGPHVEGAQARRPARFGQVAEDFQRDRQVMWQKPPDRIDIEGPILPAQPPALHVQDAPQTPGFRKLGQFQDPAVVAPLVHAEHPLPGALGDGLCGLGVVGHGLFAEDWPPVGNSASITAAWVLVGVVMT